MSADACLFVVRGKHPPGRKLPHDYPDDYDELPISGIVHVHVDDLLCGGFRTEWEDALPRINKALMFVDRKRPPVT